MSRSLNNDRATKSTFLWKKNTGQLVLRRFLEFPFSILHFAVKKSLYVLQFLFSIFRLRWKFVKKFRFLKNGNGKLEIRIRQKVEISEKWKWKIGNLSTILKFKQMDMETWKTFCKKLSVEKGGKWKWKWGNIFLKIMYENFHMLCKMIFLPKKIVDFHLRCSMIILPKNSPIFHVRCNIIMLSKNSLSFFHVRCNKKVIIPTSGETWLC